MFDIIVNLSIAILFAAVVFLGLALRKAKTLNSADEKLIEILSERLGEEFTLHLDTILAKEEADKSAAYWQDSSSQWRRRALRAVKVLNEQYRTVENLSNSVELLDAHLTEAENAAIETAQRILGGIVINTLVEDTPANEGFTGQQMLTAGTATLHDRDEWCNRFGCQPANTESLSHRSFVNDTGEDIEVPVDYYTVDRGE